MGWRSAYLAHHLLPGHSNRSMFADRQLGALADADHTSRFSFGDGSWRSMYLHNLHCINLKFEHVDKRPKLLVDEPQCQPQLCRLLIVGEAGAGKTQLLHRFADNELPPYSMLTPIPTIGIDFKVRNVQLGGRPFKLQVWDSAGAIRFRHITRAYFRGQNGVLVLWDLCNGHKEDVRFWVNQRNKYSSLMVPLVLVGTKADCLHKRRVSYAEATALAEELGCRYVECSSLTGEGVEAAFVMALQEVLASGQELHVHA